MGNSEYWSSRAGTCYIDILKGKEDITDYNSITPVCPGCSSDLHYSSGWKRRVCDTCGYIDGDRYYRVYPVAVSKDVYYFTIGQAYQLLRARQMYRVDFDDIVDNMTVHGSFYRPSGEQ